MMEEFIIKCKDGVLGIHKNSIQKARAQNKQAKVFENIVGDFSYI